MSSEMELTLGEKIEELLRPHKRGGRLTSLDWSYLACWLDAGITESAILSGIRRTIEHRRPQAPLINSLSYCAPEIFRAMQDELEERHAQGEQP